MIVIGSSSKPAQARQRKYPQELLPQGTAGVWLTPYMGRELRDQTKAATGATLPHRDQIYPMAYLVEQDPNSVLRAHFHIADQFQVFVAGDAQLATRALQAITVQFAGPYSAYGPIKSGRAGIHYITLRNRFDPGSRVMPESRGELPPPPRNYRRALGGPVHPLSPADLAALTEPAATQVIEMQSDGLCTWHYRIPSAQSIHGPDPRISDGQHWVVLAGSLDCGTETLEANSCIFVSPDEGPFAAKAGRAGLEVLALQYPMRFKR